MTIEQAAKVLARALLPVDGAYVNKEEATELATALSLATGNTYQVVDATADWCKGKYGIQLMD